MRRNVYTAIYYGWWPFKNLVLIHFKDLIALFDSTKHSRAFEQMARKVSEKSENCSISKMGSIKPKIMLRRNRNSWWEDLANLNIAWAVALFPRNCEQWRSVRHSVEISGIFGRMESAKTSQNCFLFGVILTLEVGTSNINQLFFSFFLFSSFLYILYKL